MMGVLSLAKGTINAASIMVLLILGSILIWGRGFCGWACHMRGAIEFADWILRKLKIRRYLALREKNILVNTSHRWILRIGALFVLLLPVIILIHNVGFTPKVNVMTPAPIADLPGYEGKAFAKAALFNFDVKPTWNDFLLAFGLKEKKSYWLAPIIFGLMAMSTLAFFLEGSVLAPAIGSVFSVSTARLSLINSFSPSTLPAPSSAAGD